MIFLTGPPHFQYQNEKKLAQPRRSFFTLKISWKSSPGWLQFVFLFWYWKLGGTVKKSTLYEACLDSTFQGPHPLHQFCSSSPKFLVFLHQMSSRLLFFPKIVSFMKFDHQDSLSQTCLVFLSCIPFESYSSSFVTQSVIGGWLRLIQGLFR